MRNVTFFDLDGTVLDSAPAILAALEHAIAALACEPVAASRLRAAIGTPVRQLFEALYPQSPAATIDRLVTIFRARYTSTATDGTRPFPGIVQTLHDLSAITECAIVTTKPRATATLLIEQLELSHFFAEIFGPEGDAGERKPQTLARALAHMHTVRPLAMIGDRHHDVEAAIAHDLPAIGVGWGYGTRAELEAAGVARICESPSDLTAVIAELAVTP